MILIGVCHDSSWKTGTPEWYGVDKDSYGLSTASRNVYDPRYKKSSAAGLVACTDRSPVTAFLSTDISPPDAKPRDPKLWSDTDGCGYFTTRNSESVVVGVSCDLNANQLRFYINDKIVRVTPDAVQERSGGDPPQLPYADRHIKPGQPFVWNIPDLKNCFVYFAAFNVTLTASFLQWTPPPLLAS